MSDYMRRRCEDCGADPGEVCRTPSNEPARKPHSIRTHDSAPRQPRPPQRAGRLKTLEHLDDARRQRDELKEIVASLKRQLRDERHETQRLHRLLLRRG